MKTHFENRQLSREQAGKIARSQTDLGGESQKDMIIALGGFKEAKTYEDLILGRINAYNKLDKLSQYIVMIFLESNDIDEAVNALCYTRDQVQKAISASAGYCTF